MVKSNIAYHCEGGETFYRGNGVPLSLDTLDNNRFLFISPNASEWYPCHLDSKDYTLYEITYESSSNVKVYDSFSDYHSLFGYDELLDRYIANDNLLSLIKEGYSIFILGKNDKDELQEGFIIRPKDCVKSIKVIDPPPIHNN